MSLPRSIANRVDGGTLLRVLRAVERFEDAMKCGERVSLEEHLGGTSGSERSELLHQLLGIEIDYRRLRGESPAPEDYLLRFPAETQIVRHALEGAAMSPPDEATLDIPCDPLRERAPAKIGKFFVLGRLGWGGQGSAYLARDPDLGRLVVLKRYHAAADGPEAGEAARDGKALCRLRSRYIPQCFGLERIDNGWVLVMEYVPGRNLAEVIESGLPSPRVAAKWIEQVAEGLEAVHACGLIHRVIKPSNVVLGDDGLPRLVDFGLAAHLGSVALQGVSGTPQYMAREQARGQGERIDGRTDVYGLGAVLYALLTGQPPHPGATQDEALEHARRGEVKPPRERNRSVPRQLEAIALRALEADPGRRYATDAGLRQALRGYRHRPARRTMVILAAALALPMPAWLLWPRDRPGIPTTAIPTDHRRAPAPLTGDLTVRVWAPGDRGKRGWSVEDPRTLPVLAGEKVQVEAWLNQPAYLYLLWVDGQGRVVPLHPWPDQQFEPRTTREAEEQAVLSPSASDDGWPMRGPGGLETALLLARRTPLPANTDLSALIGRLPPSPLGDPREFAELGSDSGQPVTAIYRGLHRGIGKEPEQIDDPLLGLMERLKNHFDMIRATRFAYQGE